MGWVAIFRTSALETAACVLDKRAASAADTVAQKHNRLQLNRGIWQIRPGRVCAIISDGENGGAQSALAKNDQPHTERQQRERGDGLEMAVRREADV